MGRDDILSELDEIIKQIGELRLSTIKVQENKSYTDPETVGYNLLFLPKVSKF